VEESVHDLAALRQRDESLFPAVEVVAEEAAAERHAIRNISAGGMADRFARFTHLADIRSND
jgi:hypothetical protein